MQHPLKIEVIEDLIIEVRGERVLLDRDVAQIYGVATRDINKAVSNNPGKFPLGYIVELTKEERGELVENFHRFGPLKHSSAASKAFPEKGLYMLATILKSEQATQATFTIIETFARLRQLTTTVRALSVIKDKGEQKTLMQRGGELMSELFDEELHTTDSETSVELNFAVLKFKHTVKRKKQTPSSLPHEVKNPPNPPHPVKK